MYIVFSNKINMKMIRRNDEYIQIRKKKLPNLYIQKKKTSNILTESTYYEHS